MEIKKAPINMKEVSCCFTGSRPKSLVKDRNAYSEVDSNIAFYKKCEELLLLAIEESYEQGYRRFITGMAQGVDMLAFFAVNKAKKKHPDIQNICYKPFCGQEKQWAMKGFFNQNVYHRMENMADEIYIIENTSGCLLPYQKVKQLLLERNRYMVDHSNKIISLHTKEISPYSGTKATLNYAIKKEIEIKEIIIE